ncbi:MAG TPA: carboxymuconolactone decarboxylase family protein [Candidatus Acidoferrum sp.]|nr:carboxymuconolactone decarboxylase family protein [Candidatus Acidoferrum sp.]
MSATTPRIPLLERESVTPETQAIYDALLAQRGVVPNMFKVLAYNSGIAAAMAGFLKALLSDGALKGWYKELVAVRISTLMQSEYAIRAHNASARKKGASEEQIAGVPEFEKGPYSAREKLGFCLADKLHRGPKEVDDAFFTELKKEFADAELVELLLTASAFEMFPRFIDGLHIPVTPLPASK